MIAQRFSVLRKDKKLVVFPILSGLSALAIAAAYFVPMSRAGILHQHARGEHLEPTTYAWIFLWYCTNYFVMILFNCALAACAQIRFSGGEPTLADGMAKAAAKFPNILVWAIVSATVGTILRITEDRAESFGKIVSELLGVAWAAVTYLMVPVLVFEQENVFSSIKRSGQLLRKTWGEELASSFGFGLPFLVLAIPGIMIAIVGIRYNPLAFAAAILYFLLLAAVMSAVKGIFAVALYRYATQGEAPSGFSPVMLNGAFVDVSNRD